MQDIVAEEGENRPVVINAESGSTVTVNINVRNYGYPEWFDQKAFNCLVSALSGNRVAVG